MLKKDDIPTLSWNLRWLARREEPDPTRGSQQISQRTKNTIKAKRVQALLDGNPHSEAELKVLMDQYGIERERLLSGQLYEEEMELLKSNVRFLIESLPNRENQKWADVLGVKPPQLSRWKKGEVGPQPNNQKKLLRLHGLDPDTDLNAVPLFLLQEPISDFKKKEWVQKRLERTKPTEVAKIYTALKRLLIPNEED